MTEALVDEILSDENLDRRNLRISVAYGRLAAEFAELVDPANAAWVQFAAWSSEEVGLAIRGQQTDRRWFLRVMRRVRKDYGELANEASDLFSTANGNVFDQVGRSFVGFHAALRADDVDAAMVPFLAGLNQEVCGGEGVPKVALEDAFSSYWLAASADASDAVGRARSVALGNLALAVVEQSRVQPQIREAFELFAEDWPWKTFTTRVASRLVTELALEVTMGDVHVRPGKGLPPGLAVPPDLADLVVADGRFRAYESVLPPDPPDSNHWTRLEDRVTFIAALMPLLQQSERLRGSSPFTDDERDQIERCEVPERFRRKVPR